MNDCNSTLAEPDQRTGQRFTQQRQPRFCNSSASGASGANPRDTWIRHQRATTWNAHDVSIVSRSFHMVSPTCAMSPDASRGTQTGYVTVVVAFRAVT